jgi:hypothetical protein
VLLLLDPFVFDSSPQDLLKICFLMELSLIRGIIVQYVLFLNGRMIICIDCSSIYLVILRVLGKAKAFLFAFLNLLLKSSSCVFEIRLLGKSIT